MMYVNADRCGVCWGNISDGKGPVSRTPELVQDHLAAGSNMAAAFHHWHRVGTATHHWLGHQKNAVKACFLVFFLSLRCGWRCQASSKDRLY